MRRTFALTGLATAALLALAAAPGCRGRSSSRRLVPATGGDAERGRAVIAAYGCGACHAIPGLRTARGQVGPPLAGLAERSFIAGELPNTPENLVRWVMNPHAVEPGTGMPRLGLSEEEARDVAAYLYTRD